MFHAFRGDLNFAFMTLPLPIFKLNLEGRQYRTRHLHSQSIESYYAISSALTRPFQSKTPDRLDQPIGRVITATRLNYSGNPLLGTAIHGIASTVK